MGAAAEARRTTTPLAIRTLGLLGYAGACFALALGPLALGPSDWDDLLYMEAAEQGDAIWYLRNRYVHIWSLKLMTFVVQPRALSAALYSTLLVVGLGLCGYALARRSADRTAGLCALALVPLYPSVLRYTSTPHVDLTLALWCLVTLSATASALATEHARDRLVWAALAGAAGLFALESKEPGLCAALIAPYYFAQQAERRSMLGAWLGGTCTALGALFAADLAFTESGDFYSANPLQYLGGVPQGMAKSLAASADLAANGARTVRLRKEYLRQLTEPEFVGFTLLGLAAAARDFKRSTVVQLLTAFAFGSVILSALLGSYAPALAAGDRYVLAPGAALAVLAALFVRELWREPGADSGVGWLRPLVLATLSLAVWASLRALFSGVPEVRSMVFFIVPVAIGVGFVALFLGLGRAGTRITLVALVTIASLGSLKEALDHARQGRLELAPWRALARDVDTSGVNVRLWHSGAHYPQDRVRRRLRALSTRPMDVLSLRPLGTLDDLGSRDWVFTGGEKSPALEKLGLRRLHYASTGRYSWSVYGR